MVTGDDHDLQARVQAVRLPQETIETALRPRRKGSSRRTRRRQSAGHPSLAPPIDLSENRGKPRAPPPGRKAEKGLARCQSAVWISFNAIYCHIYKQRYNFFQVLSLPSTLPKRHIRVKGISCRFFFLGSISSNIHHNICILVLSLNSFVTF